MLSRIFLHIAESLTVGSQNSDDLDSNAGFQHVKAWRKLKPKLTPNFTVFFCKHMLVFHCRRSVWWEFL